MFIFKSEKLFQLYDTEVITRTGNTKRATTLNWKKRHSMKQARYQGVQSMNALLVAVRNERNIYAFKRKIQDIVGKH